MDQPTRRARICLNGTGRAAEAWVLYRCTVWSCVATMYDSPSLLKAQQKARLSKCVRDRCQSGMKEDADQTVKRGERGRRGWERGVGGRGGGWSAWRRGGRGGWGCPEGRWRPERRWRWEALSGEGAMPGLDEVRRVRGSSGASPWWWAMRRPRTVSLSQEVVLGQQPAEIVFGHCGRRDVSRSMQVAGGSAESVDHGLSQSHLDCVGGERGACAWACRWCEIDDGFRCWALLCCSPSELGSAQASAQLCPLCARSRSGRAGLCCAFSAASRHTRSDQSVRSHSQHVRARDRAVSQCLYQCTVITIHRTLRAHGGLSQQGSARPATTSLCYAASHCAYLRRILRSISTCTCHPPPSPGLASATPQTCSTSTATARALSFLLPTARSMP